MSQVLPVGLRTTAHGVQGDFLQSGDSGFSGSLLLAHVLGISETNGGMGEWRNGRVNLKASFQLLPSSQQEQIRKKWGRHLDELFSLSRETDPDLFYEALYHLGTRLEKKDRLELAGLIYGALLSPPPPFSHSPLPPFATVSAEIQHQGKERLDAMTGAGSTANRLEFLGQRIPQHALDPSALVGMGLGGMGYRLVRNRVLGGLLFGGGKGFFNVGVPAKALAGLAGIATEAPIFTVAGTGTNLLMGREQDLSLKALGKGTAGLGIVLGSMRLAGWGFALPRVDSAWSRAAFQQAGMFGGIMAGHYLEARAGLREIPDRATFLADSFNTFFTVHVAGAATRNVFGQKFNTFERELDVQAKRIGETANRRIGDFLFPRFPVSPFLRFAPAGPTISYSPEIESRPRVPKDLHISRMTRIGESLSQTEVRGLVGRFLPLFPQKANQIFSQEIIETVARIRCRLPGFHERMLEALSLMENRGTREQFYTVMALEDVFKANALNSASGSLDYALLQLVVAQTLMHDSVEFRNGLMSDILVTLEEGLTRDKLVEFYQRLPHSPAPEPTPKEMMAFLERYDEDPAIESMSEALHNYRPQDRGLLMNFIFHQARHHMVKAKKMVEIFRDGISSPQYPPENIYAVLDYARRSPIRRLILERILYLFAVSDLPNKLTELLPQAQEWDTASHIAEILEAKGLDPEQVLQMKKPSRIYQELGNAINGTQHTGYFKDSQLAYKIAEFMVSIAYYRQYPEKRIEAKARMDSAFKDWLEENLPKDESTVFKPKLSDTDIINMLKINLSPDVDALVSSWLFQKFKIEILSEEDFEARIEAWGQAPHCEHNFFEPKETTGDKDTIFVREMPYINLKDPEWRSQAYRQRMFRQKGTVHEAGHQEHNDIYELLSSNPQDRIKSEIWAYTREVGWRYPNLDGELLKISQRLGETLASYIRTLAEGSYYRERNEKAVEKLSATHD